MFWWTARSIKNGDDRREPYSGAGPGLRTLYYIVLFINLPTTPSEICFTELWDAVRLLYIILFLLGAQLDHISQIPQQVGVTMWLSSVQWKAREGSMCATGPAYKKPPLPCSVFSSHKRCRGCSQSPQGLEDGSAIKWKDLGFMKHAAGERSPAKYSCAEL